uniref:Putative secreted protein n=1 Tax=Ixodes ricinus TaxID=34613 RepID=A0A6B0UMX7_IXORI
MLVLVVALCCPVQFRRMAAQQDVDCAWWIRHVSDRQMGSVNDNVPGLVVDGLCEGLKGVSYGVDDSLPPLPKWRSQPAASFMLVLVVALCCPVQFRPMAAQQDVDCAWWIRHVADGFRE